MIALPQLTAMRLLAIAITALLFFSFPNVNDWRGLVASLGLGHYVLSIIYARPQIRRLVTDRDYTIPLIVTGALGLAAYLLHFPLILLFGLHHVCNEVYVVTGAPKSTDLQARKSLEWNALFLNGFLYFAILRYDSPMWRVDPAILLGACAVSCTLFFRALFRVRPTMTSAQLIDSCAFEVTAVLILLLSYFVPVTFLAIVCYHFVLWCFLPLPRLAQRGSASVRNYVFLTFVCTMFFLLLSPLGVRSYPIAHSVFFEQFLLWSYVHIISSFALSRSHPEWIVKWFWPTPAVQSR